MDGILISGPLLHIKLSLLFVVVVVVVGGGKSTLVNTHNSWGEGR